jgi:fatty acid desaturase
MSVSEIRSARAEPATVGLSLAEARRILAGLFEHRAAVYWIDMLASALVGWGAFVLAVRSRGAVGAAAIVVAAFAFLRAVLFIHELAHFRRGVLPGLTWAWNVLIGVPLALPSFMYVGTHSDHHKRTLYGTARDPEYLPLARMGRLRIVRFLGEMLAVPVLLVVRFGVLSPLSWVCPPLRRLVVSRMSALVINPAYVRPADQRGGAGAWVALEVAVFFWLAGWAWAFASGAASPRVALVWYLVTALVAMINQVRTLAAHLYENSGGELTVAQQVLDSVNVRGLPLATELVFPVGLKYHALHHFVPDLPYHSLAAAHRRLLAELPAESPYRRAEHAGLVRLARELWSKAKVADGARGAS